MLDAIIKISQDRRKDILYQTKYHAYALLQSDPK